VTEKVASAGGPRCGGSGTSPGCQLMGAPLRMGIATPRQLLVRFAEVSLLQTGERPGGVDSADKA
jgi:hypothetical protein